MSEQWSERAACAGQPIELFFDETAVALAKRLCKGCPVREDCLQEALDHHIRFGVWGGMTERERRARQAGRGRGYGALKTHCAQNHPFNEANTYIRSDGSRACRTCTNNRRSLNRAKQMEAA